MSAEWTQKPIDAPAADLLTQTEVAKLLRVSEDTVKRLVADGELPAGLKVGRKVVLWDWESVAYYRLRVKLASRLGGSNRPISGADGGQEGADGG